MNLQFLKILYFLTLAAELYAQASQSLYVQYFSKPALILILIVYFDIAVKKVTFRLKHLIAAALGFSWLGDVLLLLDKQYKNLFIYGLIAFLAAHLCYIFYFLKIGKINRAGKLPNKLIFAAIAVYTISLFSYLAPNVKNLLVPVAVYAIVISTMLAVSITAFDFAKQNFGKLAVLGTFLFVVSDSILAINRFAAPFAYAPVFIMLTYGLAQFFIAESSLRNLREI